MDVGAVHGVRNVPLLYRVSQIGTPLGGDGRVYLRWKAQLEDERVLGWKVRQLKPTAEVGAVAGALNDPAYGWPLLAPETRV
jgi:hypothetical protein